MKTSKFIFLINVLAIVAFTLQTCKPEEEHKTYGPYTLGEGNDYINFKPGSWWVYQNSKSGLYDTLVLKSISIKSQTFIGKNTIIKDMVNMLIFSTTTKYEYEYYSSGANPDAIPEYLKNVNFISLIHGKSKAGDYQGETISFFFPFDSNRNNSLGVGVTTYVGLDSILDIKGILFNNVRKFEQTQDACWDGFTCRYYWGQNVGLVKKEKVAKNESWELVNYHVEKA